MPKLANPTFRRLCYILGLLVTSTLALAPWWHNRLFIRDFFDYGLMMIAAGRLNDGETPWVDFLSPHQSGSLWINAWAERWLGGDYQALTWGNAWFIVLSVVGLVFLLKARTAPWSTFIITLGIVAGSASQHTIIWYNSIGTITLAGIAWASAQAPVWSRENCQKILLVAALLVLSGTNKLNFHVLALIVACTWTLRSGLVGGKSKTQVSLTLLTWLIAGLIIPILGELQISGATLAQWKHNIIDLPFSDRGSNFSNILTLQFHLQPMHDYYGPVLNPVGAILVAWIGLTMVLAWPNRSKLDRSLLIGAGCIAVGGVGGLMATNHEIVYVTLAAGISLLVSLWLGFGIWQNQRFRIWGLVTPTAVLAVIMLHSAWLGQRSQFGHSHAPRSTYKTFQTENGIFDYFKGLKIPPRLYANILALESSLPAADSNGVFPVFYATGAEFLERIWPNHHLPELPLLLNSMAIGNEQDIHLQGAFVTPATYRLLIGSKAWKGSWPAGLGHAIGRNSNSSQDIGLFEIHFFNGNWLHAGIPPVDDAIAGRYRFGGNIDTGEITVDSPMWSFDLPDGRAFWGTHKSEGSFLFKKPTYRLRGEVALSRLNSQPEQNLTATFRVLDASIPEGEMGSIIWEKFITLSREELSRTHPYEIDTRGQPSRFQVHIHDSSRGLLKAGFTAPFITHSHSSSASAPTLREPAHESFPNPKRVSASLLPSSWTNSVKIEMKGGKISEAGAVELSSGDELWLKPNRPIQELIGRITRSDSSPSSSFPMVRVVWYRGGRLEILHQKTISPAADSTPFNAWPAEPDGWYGILIDSTPTPTPLQISIESIQEQ